MSLVVLQQLIDTWKVQAMRQRREFARVGRHRVFLLVVHQLQRMLDRPQEDIAIRQTAVFVGMQHSRVSQSHEPVESIGRTNVAGCDTMYQLQRLHDELNVADRSCPKFHFTPLAAASA